jgi:predicted enzyme related to lactoylglutathione lyase
MLMQVQNVLAHVDVADYDEGVRWYAQLLGRAPDRLMMDGCAEWQLASTGALQLYASADPRPSTVVLAIDDMDVTVEQVRERGMALDVVDELGARFRLASIPDPWGNTVTFAHENAMTFS